MAAQTLPDVVEADRDSCPHMMWAMWPEDRNGHQASLGFWRTHLGLVVKSAESSLDVRGRDMVRWIAGLGHKVRVVEVVRNSEGFWHRMRLEGLIDAWIPSDGFPSPLEHRSIPFA